MTGAKDDELNELRARAYGPRADINGDLAALHRLRELEAEGYEQQPLGENASTPELSAHGEQSVGVEHDMEPEPNPLAERGLGLRRSIVLLIVGLVVVATSTSVALILIEGVQVGPSQAAADQVARLSIDRSYEVPKSFGGPSAEPSSSSAGFQEFYGIRAIVTPVVFFGGSSGKACLVLYHAATVDAVTPTLPAGFLSGSCAAGNFPAVVQFSMDDEGVPAELSAAFPDATALQFVYDRANKEVVVLSGR